MSSSSASSEPYLLDLSFRGFILGLKFKDKSSGNTLCYSFGGIPYAQPPKGDYRWRRARELAPCYRYGTRKDPGRFTGKANVCPQLGRKSNLFDEDCLQCNVWIPAGEPQKDGWPVYFYIHGGFLQAGNINSASPVALLSQTAFKCIIVMAAYRLNIFGFLASRELLEEAASNNDKTVGNLGFWDLRLALEWTFKNVSYFGGNANNITVGGYSAGAHAVFHQLAYDIGQPGSKQLIRRVCMFANGPGVQPKSLAETQQQFDELLSALDIPTTMAATEKLARLRSTSTDTLLAATRRLRLHQFRAVSDGAFVRPTLFAELADGSFARRLRARRLQVLVGESSNEHFVYGQWHTPRDGIDALFQRLLADYPRAVCEAIVRHYFPHGQQQQQQQLPAEFENWKDAFGKIYADVQIHVTQRGFVDALCRGGAADLVHRYRVEWRAKCVDKRYPKDWGATHGADDVIWFFGNRQQLLDDEKIIVRKAFLDEAAKHVKGQEMRWLAQAPQAIRRLRTDGKVEIWKDELWNQKMAVWKELQDAMAKADRARPSL